ncbi:carboxypeptidase B-like isoform X2 [Ostrinia furnacalis]|uniref:carboxypeptidase B-like isoform X2 n=1 Tax=Ostrinia furnacalis TaxID=93504 RepID=UPI00103BDA8F|nr:carboxypeptidase B-like isoform X2 [Ostrinia furnacalis]
MSVVVDPGPRKVGSVLRKNFLQVEEVEDEDFHPEADKTESGTQTKFGKGKGKCIPSGMIQKCIKHIIIPNHKPKKRKIKLMDWKKYHRLNVIYAFLDELERDFPAICTVSVIGKSVEGRDIKMLKISNSNASNCAVWLDGSIHPREWITTAVVTYIADVIVKNFPNLSTSITNKDWHIVPVLNPDGYEYTYTHDRMWRKNRACYDGEYGVDLNRNFSYGWGNNGDEGSSEDPNNVFYRGPAPFSEPETAAVRLFRAYNISVGIQKGSMSPLFETARRRCDYGKSNLRRDRNDLQSRQHKRHDLLCMRHQYRLELRHR